MGAMLKRLFILRYLWSSTKGSTVKTIALISVGGIGIGVLAMVVVLSVMAGFDEAIKTRLLGVEPHLIVDSSVPDAQEQNRGVGEEREVTQAPSIVMPNKT